MEEVLYHRHNGFDAPKIGGVDLIGFMVLEVVPTHLAEQGTLVVGKDTGIYKLYCMINGSWTVL